MKRTFLPLLASFLLVNTFIWLNEAKNETVVDVPYQTGSTWIWAWISKASEWKKLSRKIVYYVCDTNVAKEPKYWLRSQVFHVRDARRADVTVKYAVSDCSLGFDHCKTNLKLFIYKTSEPPHPVPEPSKKPEVYQLFGTTLPTNLTSSPSLSRNKTNTEKYSFVTNSSTPYHYLAIQYQGGCFALYSVTISYSVCASMVLPTSLIQLPRIMAPVNGSIQVSGSCAANAQSLANNMTLYGDCNGNGEWSSNAISGECWCDAGFGKYLNGSGAHCNACPSGTYHISASNTPCIKCPVNSKENINRTVCDCKPLHYRIDNETYVDNCTGPPSKPQNLQLSYLNSTSVSLTWSTPLDIGSRSDLYYQVQCKKCDDKAEHCNINCNSAVTHTPRTSNKATVQDLSAYTYYQFKVFAKNGVSNLAEINDNRKPKFAEILVLTKESVPGIPDLSVEVISATTMKLTWTIKVKNGIILYYHVTYYEKRKLLKHSVNTTKTSITIPGLKAGKTYVFQVQGSTKEGLGPLSENVQKKLPYKDQVKDQIKKIYVIAAVGGVVSLLILVIVILCICLCKRKRRRKDEEGRLNFMMLHSDHMLSMEDCQKMYIDPSTYNSPMEALLSNAQEIDFHSIKLEKSIGGGEFAEVYKGILSKESETEIVAVKILKPNVSHKSREDFILEASIMGQFQHPNVIELKGVVTRSPDSPMMIVTEFMENGSLDHVLKLHDGKLTVLQLVGIARGVAAGMAYLAEMNFIHRDLAARNVLVADNMASKISDFGLSRELDDSEDNPDSEYTTQGGKIPIRWTAPEAIRYRKFSSASDVWSFGILLWEIMSYAERPYWDWDNFQVMDRVEEGYRLPAPMDCPKSIHNIMLDCWEADKNKRPKFADVVKVFDELIRSPEKITDDSANNRYATDNVDVNLDEETPVEKWLESISMARYVNMFADAGYVDLRHVKAMEEDDLTRIGVKLIGHRNKISKSIKAINTRAQLKQKPDKYNESDKEAIV